MSRADLLAWRCRDGRCESPKVIAEHRGSCHTQQVHVHPCVHADRAIFPAAPDELPVVDIRSL